MKVLKEIERLTAARNELISIIARHRNSDGFGEVAPGLACYKASAPLGPIARLSEPSFCLIAQGSKAVFLGAERYLYDASQYLLVTAGLPLVSHFVQASYEKPFLGVRIVLDPAAVTNVLVECADLPPPTSRVTGGLTISKVTHDLLDAVVRMFRLVDVPRDYRAISPLIMREIVYRLLLGEQRGRLSQIASLGAAEQRMSRAIDTIRRNYDKPLYIARLAKRLGMSVSGFHHHFKSATAMSPLQFQKQIRLQEARRLLTTDSYDAATAAYQVGYDDASQFSREYKRLFGAPPMRDVERMRQPLRRQ